MAEPLAAGVSYFDLSFRNTPRIVATAMLQGSGGVALLDPGPSSTLPVLRRELAAAGLRVGDLTAIVLTHIHLDHAGATGTLLRENPALRVFVHERGAPHLADPSKLLASASRLYGDQMAELWGDVLPVPVSALVALSGGERIEAGGRWLDVEYTPGHASHHVSYFSADTGIAFVGDTAGIRRRPGGFVLPPTPPPDIDLEAWHASLALIGRRQADTLFLTHFGPSSPAGSHLSEMSDHLELVGTLAKSSLAREASDADRETWFADQMRTELARRLGEAEVHGYEVAGRFDLNWRGLARYWTRRAGTASG